jgi:hypothetical protein
MIVTIVGTFAVKYRYFTGKKSVSTDDGNDRRYFYRYFTGKKSVSNDDGTFSGIFTGKVPVKNPLVPTLVLFR